jgi:molecular chaperone GrpE
MSKRFKDERGEYRGESEPIVLTPEAAIDPNPSEPSYQGRGIGGGPTPLSVEESIQVLGEIENLNARIQELTKELEAKDREISQLRASGGTETTDAAGASNAGEAADVDAKDQEIAELKDKYLRALAEHENARRRIRQQSEDSVRVQKENLLRDLLPIVDNLERAVDAAKGKGDGRSIIEGVQLVLASLIDLLKVNGVRPITSLGEPFNPNRHEAADHVPHSSHPPNTVVAEFHRGYTINDKVLRPARVVVSKGDGNGKGT